MAPSAAWFHGLALYASCFTQPSLALFRELVSAWVLCPGRRTVTRMLRLLPPQPRRAHDAYHRFLRAGAWNLADLWGVLARGLVAAWARGGVVQLDVDDTLFHKTGRRIAGAGTFRDAVRSVGKSVVYALGLNLVLVTLRLTPPWGGAPLALPVNARLYRKGGPTHLELAAAMVREVAAWFPGRRLALAGDGAYASLAGRSLPRTEVTSRLRRDAALYEAPRRPKRPRRGRPAKKGRRLLTPETMARRQRTGWRRAQVDLRGRKVERLLFARPVLWYAVCKEKMVLLVIARDPARRQPDDFFFTTALEDPAQAVASRYAGRWSIEDTFRNVKQLLGGEDPQTWKEQGPERAASLSLWLYAAIWNWYLATQGTRQTWPDLPWYAAKKTPSFADALAALRSALWRQRIFVRSAPPSLAPKIARAIIDILARAA